MTQKITPSHLSPNPQSKQGRSHPTMTLSQALEQFDQSRQGEVKSSGGEMKTMLDFLTQHGLVKDTEKGHASLHFRVKPVTD